MDRQQEPKYDAQCRDCGSVDGTLFNRENGEAVDEPVFIFRAQDTLLPQVLEYYGALLEAQDNPDPTHLAVIEARHRAVVDWQRAHPERVKQPDSRSDTLERCAVDH